jgi:hypothetical protein
MDPNPTISRHTFWISNAPTLTLYIKIDMALDNCGLFSRPNSSPDIELIRQGRSLLIFSSHMLTSILKLILNHQESRCTEKLNIAPKHRSSNYESIQTIIFIQPGLSLYPFSCRITRQLNLNCFAQYWQKLSFFGHQRIFLCCFKFPLPFLPEHSLPHLEQLFWLF